MQIRQAGRQAGRKEGRMSIQTLFVLLKRGRRGVGSGDVRKLAFQLNSKFERVLIVVVNDVLFEDVAVFPSNSNRRIS